MLHIYYYVFIEANKYVGDGLCIFCIEFVQTL